MGLNPAVALEICIAKKTVLYFKKVIGENSGRVVVALGLLRYAGGEVVLELFESRSGRGVARVWIRFETGP